METLPDPLVPAEVDLRDFAFMPLDVQRLRDSDLASDETPEACWAAVLLWCASWHQIPAASIPDSDQWQAKHSGYVAQGRVSAGWKDVRAGAMRGWVLCADGRLYHPVVAEKAKDAWDGKLHQRWKTECARIKKHNQRHNTTLPINDFEVWKSLGCPWGQTLFVPGDAPPPNEGHKVLVPGDSAQVSEGQGGSVPRETHSKGQGEGQGQGQKREIPPLPPKAAKTPAIGLKAWVIAEREAGRKLIPEDDPVFAYANEVGIPGDFLALAWAEFRHRYSQPDAKRYRDWRSVFRKAVRGNWLKLWWLDAGAGGYALTTVGEQARRASTKEAA